MDVFVNDWMAVALSVLVCAGAIMGLFIASVIFSAKRKSQIKLTTYECGIPSEGFTWANINFRFYIFGILFLIFDVEAVFLFPWALIFLEQSSLGNPIPFYAMMMFLVILFFAILYGWRKGVFEWQK